MSAVKAIKGIIAEMPEGAVFSAKHFRKNASADNIKQILSRLAREKIINRAARGVYQKPKIIEGIVCDSSVREIIDVIAKTSGEILIPHGSEAVRQLNLSTQVPMRFIFHTNGASRKLTVGKHTVELRHASPSRLIAPNSPAGIAISALLYLGRANVTFEIIDHIKCQLSEESFQHMLDETENMPAWLASVLYHYQKEAR